MLKARKLNNVVFTGSNVQDYFLAGCKLAPGTGIPYAKLR